MLVLIGAVAGVGLAAGTPRKVAGHEHNDGIPRWSPDGTRISFTANGTNVRGYPTVIGVDGRGELALHNEWATWPVSWSPDGRWVAFAIANPGSINNGLWIARTDGAERRRILSAWEVLNAEWSPDGSRIAYLHTPNRYAENATLRIIGVDGTGDVTVSGRGAYEPRWSPDGRTLAFPFLTGIGSSSIRIFLVGADGTGLRRLTTLEAEQRAFDWSPDGRAIAFTGPGRDGGRGVWVSDIDGSQTRQILAVGRSPAWSSRNRIAAVSTCNDRGCIADVSPDGTGKRKLADYTGVGALDWSPDGRRIVFDGTVDHAPNFDIYVVDVPAYRPQPTRKPCTVPRLRGKTLAGAKKALARANCRLGKVRRVRSSRVRRGRVISQQPPAGRRLANGARVAVVVAR